VPVRKPGWNPSAPPTAQKRSSEKLRSSENSDAANADPRHAGGTAASSPDDDTRRRLRILVVEDELMIRMLLEDMLMDSGYEIAASAGRLDEAVRCAGEAEFDLAILDVNIAGQSVAPVAEIIEQRGRPFVFATGYGERGLPDKYRGRPTLQKPFQQDNLDRVLAKIAPAVTT
jgi:CheY-like chemotaxis protein